MSIWPSLLIFGVLFIPSFVLVEGRLAEDILLPTWKGNSLEYYLEEYDYVLTLWIHSKQYTDELDASLSTLVLQLAEHFTVKAGRVPQHHTSSPHHMTSSFPV